MEDFDLQPSPEIPHRPVKGRGAAGNVAHRFSSETRQAEDDGWEQAEPSLPQTRLLVDSAKSIISRNDSPDVGFEQSLNPYRGCEHGCIYCYARPTHAYLGLSPGLDFETQIFHKPDAPRLLREELSHPDYVCSTIVLGTATDAYQPFERKARLTRALLEVALETGHPLSVVTKSSLVVRDIDLWAELAGRNLAHIGISLTTLDGQLARQLEPRASAPRARLDAMQKLSDAGIPVSVFVSPVIPGLNDHELENLLAAARVARRGKRVLHAAASAARGGRAVSRVAGMARTRKGGAHHVGALRLARRTRQRCPFWQSHEGTGTLCRPHPPALRSRLPPPRPEP